MPVLDAIEWQRFDQIVVIKFWYKYLQIFYTWRCPTLCILEWSPPKSWMCFMYAFCLLSWEEYFHLCTGEWDVGEKWMMKTYMYTCNLHEHESSISLNGFSNFGTNDLYLPMHRMYPWTGLLFCHVVNWEVITLFDY